MLRTHPAQVEKRELDKLSLEGGMVSYEVTFPMTGQCPLESSHSNSCGQSWCSGQHVKADNAHSSPGVTQAKLTRK